ncbi:MAG TPA: hypothetical protein DHV59_11090 [Oxalobacteraceae bacterium]|nr:hypothetical protein [Oxalobacteraceae bacterium]
MSLAITAIRGAYFTSIALAFRQAISFLTVFYIARILTPSDFGIAAMVMVVVGLAQVIGDIGFSAGLVRSQKNTSTVLSTCFWIGLGIGIFLTLTLILIAPLAAMFYGVDTVAPLLRVAAWGLLVNFCTPVPLAILQQRLGYGELALSQAFGSLAGAVVAVVLATAGLGIWSLVIQPIAGNVLALALMIIYTKWRPTWEYNYASVRDILYDGLNLLGSSISQYARNNFDTVVIGNAMDSKDLGVYSMARTILYAPMYLITSVVSRVIFPLLAKVQGEPEKVKDTILTATTRTGLLIFPLYIGLMVVANDFVFLAFGDNWLEIVPLIRIMILPAMIQSISHLASPIMVALGASGLSLRISAGGALFYFATLLCVIPYGLTAVAYGYAVTNSLVGSISIFLALRLAQIPISAFLHAMLRPLFFSIIMMAVLMAIRTFFLHGSHLRLAILIVSGALVYACLVFLFEKKAWQQVASAFKAKHSL